MEIAFEILCKNKDSIITITNKVIWEKQISIYCNIFICFSRNENMLKIISRQGKEAESFAIIHWIHVFLIDNSDCLGKTNPYVQFGDDIMELNNSHRLAGPEGFTIIWM